MTTRDNSSSSSDANSEGAGGSARPAGAVRLPLWFEVEIADVVACFTKWDQTADMALDADTISALHDFVATWRKYLKQLAALPARAGGAARPPEEKEHDDQAARGVSVPGVGLGDLSHLSAGSSGGRRTATDDIDELRIVVFRSNELRGYKLCAALAGASPPQRGYGTNVETAIHDLFTGGGARKASMALEQLSRASDVLGWMDSVGPFITAPGRPSAPREAGGAAAPGEYFSACTEPEFPAWWDEFGVALVLHQRVNTEMLALAAFSAGRARGERMRRELSQPATAPGETPREQTAPVLVTDIGEIASILEEYVDCPEVWAPTIARLRAALTVIPQFDQLIEAWRTTADECERRTAYTVAEAYDDCAAELERLVLGVDNGAALPGVARPRAQEEEEKKNDDGLARGGMKGDPQSSRTASKDGGS